MVVKTRSTRLSNSDSDFDPHPQGARHLNESDSESEHPPSEPGTPVAGPSTSQPNLAVFNQYVANAKADNTKRAYSGTIKAFKEFSFEKGGQPGEYNIDIVDDNLQLMIFDWLQFLKKKKKKKGTIQNHVNGLKYYYRMRGRTLSWLSGVSAEESRNRNPALDFHIEQFIIGCGNDDIQKGDIAKQATPILLQDMQKLVRYLTRSINREEPNSIVEPHEAIFLDTFFTAAFLLMARFEELAKLRWDQVKLHQQKEGEGETPGRKYHLISLVFRKTNQNDPTAGNDYAFYEFDAKNQVDPKELDLYRKLSEYAAVFKEASHDGLVFGQISRGMYFKLHHDTS